MAATILKKILFIAIILLMSEASFAQYATIVDIVGIDDKNVKAKIDDNASRLLSEINNAFFKGTVPSLTDIEMTTNAKSNVLALWETSPFRFRETEIIDNGLKLYSGGFELRNIQIFMKEADSTDKNQEGVLVFSKIGTIEDMYLAIGTKQYQSVMKEGNGVTDLRRRQMILNFVEDFRTSYNRKDISFINKVFSEDALIIVGRNVKQQTGNSDFLKKNLSDEKIEYFRKDKTQYIKDLERVFARNEYLNIKFEEIKVVQHDIYPELYGVTVKQFWNTSTYSDVGYVFLMIDFKDEDTPIIHVRTWQPEKYSDGREIDKSEIIEMGDLGNLNRK
ncbi:MAG: nuclear transport factor 2 family protein [Lentimicrobium sp.]|jgi:hypothetical protein|nr:nuclear transport factor 2 family protein [Lentimicrobium sp.]